MNAFALYLFFTLDSFRTCAEVFLTLSSALFVVGLLVFGIGFLVTRYESYTRDDVRLPRADEWCARWKSMWKWWGRILIPVFCMSLAIYVALPNTKQAIAIYVIPKVLEAAKNNDDLMALPQDVVKVARTYLKKVMTEWAREMEQEVEGSDELPADEALADSVLSPTDKAKIAVRAAEKAVKAADKIIEEAKKVLK